MGEPRKKRGREKNCFFFFGVETKMNYSSTYKSKTNKTNDNKTNLIDLKKKKKFKRVIYIKKKKKKKKKKSRGKLRTFLYKFLVNWFSVIKKNCLELVVTNGR